MKVVKIDSKKVIFRRESKSVSHSVVTEVCKLVVLIGKTRIKPWLVNFDASCVPSNTSRSTLLERVVVAQSIGLGHSGQHA